MPYIVTSDCIQCGACAAGCESNAITEGDTQSHIDVTICIECGVCKQNCPSDAIIFEEDEKQIENLPGTTLPEAVADPG
jgi:ferredoxin